MGTIAEPLGWINRIKAGDVVKSRTGLLRVVRDVSHHIVSCGGTKPHVRTCVVFSIKACSWTHRCYTVYTGNDLVQYGYRRTTASVSLRKKIDKAILAEIRKGGKKAGMTCCDVVGVS